MLVLDFGFGRVLLCSHPHNVMTLSTAGPLISGRAVDHRWMRCGRDTSKTRLKHEQRQNETPKKQQKKGWHKCQPLICFMELT